MKGRISVIVFVIGCVAGFFYLRSAPLETEKPYLLSYEVGWRGDTFNKTDLSGLKQGKWFIYRYNNPESHTNGRQLDSVGFYKDGKKVGYWKTGDACDTEDDSVLYVGCRAQLEDTKTYTFTPRRDILFADTTKKKAAVEVSSIIVTVNEQG